MSHHGHPVIAFCAVALATTLWFAHGKAQENNRYIAEKTEIKADVIFGFLDLGISKRYYYLLGVADDDAAALKLLMISRHAGMAWRFAKGDRISVDEQERDVEAPYVCLRAYGEPDCYWAPARTSVE